MENKKIKLEKLVMENGWVSELKLFIIHLNYLNGKDHIDKYSAKVNSEKIVIHGDDSWLPGGEYDKKTKEVTWYLNHVCGLSGYNPMLGDRCDACENNGKTNDKKIGATYNNRDLADIIDYVKNLDDKIALQKIRDGYFN